MGPPVALADPALGGGTVAAAAAVAVMLLARSPRIRGAAAVVAMALAAAVVAITVATGEEFASLGRHTSYLAAMGGAGLVALCVAVPVFMRWPGVAVVAMVAALPLRIPLGTGDSTANLLGPLYLVLAAGALASAIGAWRGRAGRRPLDARDGGEPARSPNVLEWALAAAVVLYGVQSLYSPDTAKAAQTAAFFFVPFAVMFRLAADAEWSGRVVRWAFALLMAEAAVFVAIGYGELATQKLLWNEKVIQGNAFAAFFRVNSVFFDPNIFGRFLDVALVALMAVALWWRRGAAWQLWALAGFAVVLWGGVFITFSQSSMVALLAGMVALAAVRWSPRASLATAAGAVVLAIVVGGVFLATGIGTERFKSVDEATAGRISLVGGGGALFVERPVWGFGSGGFSREFESRKLGTGRESASHTAPVTVAAEQGAVGLAAWLFVVLSAGFTLFAGTRARPSAERAGSGGGRRVAARAALGAIFVVITVHSLVYADFWEDPYLWATLGIGAALAGRKVAGAARGRRRDDAEPDEPEIASAVGG